MLFSFSNHQKTVTCLCFDGSHTRLLSGSIDRYYVMDSGEHFSLPLTHPLVVHVTYFELKKSYPSVYG